MEGRLARSKPAAQGHNSALSDEEVEALQHKLTTTIRAARRAVEEARALLKSRQQDVNSAFALVKAHLGYQRKDFEEVLDLAEMDEADFIAREASRTRMMRMQGLPVGQQLDMFGAGQGDTADDAARAFADGRRAGLRADDPVLPKHISTMFADDWMKGWHDGQAHNILLLGKADSIIAARDAKKNAGTMQVEPEEPADDDSDRDEQDGEIDQDAVDAQAKALKGSGWAQPTAEEAAFA